MRKTKKRRPHTSGIRSAKRKTHQKSRKSKPLWRGDRKLSVSPPVWYPAKDIVPGSLPSLPSQSNSSEEEETVNYDVIRFPVINWSFRWQRPQQMSLQFAQNGHRVFYVTTDITGIGKEGASYEEVVRFVKIINIDQNVWLITLCANRPLNLYQDTMGTWDILYFKWSLDYVRSQYNMIHFVSIVDLPFWTPLLTAMDQHPILYDCMDHHAGFSTNHPGMLNQEADLLANADLVTVSSLHLQELAEAHNSSVILLRNAADVQHFSVGQSRSNPLPSYIQGPIIGYYGAISDWFDIELIEELAHRRPEWTFVLIGETFGCDTSRAEQLPNVLLLGEKPYQELPSYLHRFDVALIPFKHNKLTQATNPVKLYEYYAAGKPVVSVNLPEVTAIAPNITWIADTAEQFEQAIEEALDMGEHAVQERISFAEQNQWQNRYQTLHAAIMEHVYPKVSIIIVAHNNWAYTRQCIDSIMQKNRYPNLEVVIVDNGSTDQTPYQLSRIRSPYIKCVSASENLGFSAGNTLGVQNSDGEYIILLNNDTIVPDGSWISRLLRPFHEDPLVGMTGPMSNHVGNDQALDYFVGNPVIGAHPKWLNDFYYFHRGKSRITDLLGFFCVAIKRQAWDKTGALDTQYGLGMFEDDDYCERIKREGYKLVIVEDAFVYHHGSATIQKLSTPAYESLWNRNKAYYEQKWGKEWRWPKPPENLFRNADCPEEIAKRVQETDKSFILILGSAEWRDDEAQRVQSIVRELAVYEDVYVIAYLHQYCGSRVIGTRKAGPRLYFTERVDLFCKVRFDGVLYCGLPQVLPELQTEWLAADALSYHHHQLTNLQSNLPQLIVLNEPGIIPLTKQLLDTGYRPEQIPNSSLL